MLWQESVYSTGWTYSLFCIHSTPILSFLKGKLKLKWCSGVVLVVDRSSCLMESPCLNYFPFTYRLPFCLWLLRFLLVSSCSGRAVTGFGAGGGHARLPVPSELLALTPAKLDGKAQAETWDVCCSEGPCSSHSSQTRTKIRVLWLLKWPLHRFWGICSQVRAFCSDQRLSPCPVPEKKG